MPMTPFVERFRELGARETRSLTVTGRNDLPDGDYGFFELYCNEPDCDCRRVVVAVLRPGTGWKKFWATFNYGWESVEFYQKWAGAPDGDRSQWQGLCSILCPNKPGIRPRFWIYSSFSSNPRTTCSV
jgi:hypothetical protein